MNEERPIVFTINKGKIWYTVSTKDHRGEDYIQRVSESGLFTVMLGITTELNNKGYAVLFEVE